MEIASNGGSLMRLLKSLFVTALVVASVSTYSATVLARSDGSVADATAASEARYVDAFLGQDHGALMALFSEDARFVDQTFGDLLVGHAAVSDMERAVIGMTDADATRLLDHFTAADGSHGVTIWQWVGTNAYGSAFDMPVVVIHEYVDGSITSESLYYADRFAYEELTSG